MIHFAGLLAVLLYLSAGFAYVRSLSVVDAPDSLGARDSRGRWLLLGALTAHVLFLVTFFNARSESNTFGEPTALGTPTVLSFVAVFLVAVFLLVERVRGVSVLGVFLSPVAAALALVSGILFHFPKGGSEFSQLSPLLLTHLCSAVLGHVALTLAFVTSLGVLVKEHYLRAKRLPLLAQKLPPLEKIDQLSGMLLNIGFVAMFIGVVTGIWVALDAGIALFSAPDPRLITSMLTLFVYGTLLIARGRYGWRGRRAALLASVGFGTVIVSFAEGYLLQTSFHVY